MVAQYPLFVKKKKIILKSSNLFGNFSFRTGYSEMRCLKSRYFSDFKLASCEGTLFPNRSIAYPKKAILLQSGAGSNYEGNFVVTYAGLEGTAKRVALAMEPEAEPRKARKKWQDLELTNKRMVEQT